MQHQQTYRLSTKKPHILSLMLLSAFAAMGAILMTPAFYIGILIEYVTCSTSLDFTTASIGFIAIDDELIFCVNSI